MDVAELANADTALSKRERTAERKGREGYAKGAKEIKFGISSLRICTRSAASSCPITLFLRTTERKGAQKSFLNIFFAPFAEPSRPLRSVVRIDSIQSAISEDQGLMLDTHLRQPAPSLAPWPMLLAFTLGFAMSNAFRTVAAILAPPLQADMGLSPQQLGVFAGAFHFAFGALQLFVGIGMDVHGPRRTVLAVSPLAVAGAVLAACATGFPMLLAAQVLIGIGCAPAFVACTIFISRRFPAGRFAAVSGQVLGIGSAGMLLTGTPLAWLVEHLSWRAGFAALAVGSTLGWLAVLLLVQEAPQGEASRVRLGEALRGYGELLRQPHTWGIVALGACTYASFMALRGLWLGPLLVERHGFSLVASGNVALAVSALAIVALPLFGRLDPGDIHRRRWIVGHTLLLAAMFALLAFSRSAWLDVGIALAMSVATGFIVWQYADVRAAYPARMTGRAMAVFTMAMFLGVAVVQWLTGLGASLAAQWQMDVFATVFAGLAALLLLGAAAFAGLPAPPRRA